MPHCFSGGTREGLTRSWITASFGCRQQIRSGRCSAFAKGGMPLLAKYTKLHFANTEKAQKLLATISRQSVDSEKRKSHT